MKPEELLQLLRDGGLDDEAIKGLLEEVLKALEPQPQVEPEKPQEVEETEEEKEKRIFGI